VDGPETVLDGEVEGADPHRGVTEGHKGRVNLHERLEGFIGGAALIENRPRTDQNRTAGALVGIVGRVEDDLFSGQVRMLPGTRNNSNLIVGVGVRIAAKRHRQFLVEVLGKAVEHPERKRSEIREEWLVTVVRGGDQKPGGESSSVDSLNTRLQLCNGDTKRGYVAHLWSSSSEKK